MEETIIVPSPETKELLLSVLSEYIAHTKYLLLPKARKEAEDWLKKHPL